MNIFRNLFQPKLNRIERNGDLKPLGVKYTIRGNYSFNETFEHIHKERLNPSKI